MSVPRSILLAALVAAAACSDDNGDDGGSGPDPEGDIIVENNDFDPSTLEVAQGATVVWAWSSGGVTHNVTFDDGEQSGNRSSGTYTRTFAAAGTFPYHCTLHGSATSGMRGSVTVTAPSTGEDGNGGSGGGGNGGGGNGGGGGYPGGDSGY
jgi:plastocyanin